MNKGLILLVLLGVSFAISTEKVLENNAADQLVSEISRMEGSIREEQHNHDVLHEQQSVECVTEFSFRSSEINDGTNALSASQAALARCQTAQAYSQADLEKAYNYVSTINNILDGLASQRAAEKLSFEQLIEEELNPAIAAVEGAYPILRDFASQAASFVQFTSHLNKVFTHMIKTNKANQFSAMVAVLMQAPDWQHGVNGDVIQQLEQLFDDLLDDLNKAKDHAIEVENQAASLYAQIVEQYNAVLSTLQSTIQSLKVYLNELSVCIENETSVSSSADNKVLRNQEALNHAIDMCQAFETEYQNATSGRNDELVLLTKLKVFIKQQEDIFGNYGNDGVDSFGDYKKSFEANREQSRGQFMQLKLKNFKQSSLIQRGAPQPIKCTTCRKSFVQKKLGF